jgi:hypothetical protein
MNNLNTHTPSDKKEKYKILFFAGAETHENKFNIFTGSFIKLMNKILNKNFEFIKGIYYKVPAINVLWALNHAQKPISDPENNGITSAAFKQIVSAGLSPDTQLVIIASSSGTVVAAQTACYLARQNRNNIYFHKPFHLVLGASMISEKSDLFRQLLHYHKEGTIGTIIHAEVQDEGDSSAGVGGQTRMEAYSNAIGLMCPWLSKKYHGPSFLNTHPLKGHIHRKRSKTVQKALDYIDIILVKHKLAGEYYCERAVAIIKDEKL